MLLDASVARSIAVLGWVDQLAQAIGGSLRIAHGVLADLNEPSELRRIRDALQREANMSRPGSGRYSRALAAVHDLDHILGLPPTITLLYPDTNETRMTARLTSREPAEREVETPTRAPRTLARRRRGCVDRYRPDARP
jgi:hypothetical protein